MKVYILLEYDIEAHTEIIGVFDSLEKAQSYEHGKSEDWTTDRNNKGWWERTMIYGASLSIVEWEVQ